MGHSSSLSVEVAVIADHVEAVDNPDVEADGSAELYEAVVAASTLVRAVEVLLAVDSGAGNAVDGRLD